MRRHLLRPLTVSSRVLALMGFPGSSLCLLDTSLYTVATERRLGISCCDKRCKCGCCPYKFRPMIKHIDR